MDELIDICVKNMVSDDFTEEQARAYMKEMLPKLDYWKRYDELSDNGEFEEFKKQLIKEINELHIDGLPKVEKLNALVGKWRKSGITSLQKEMIATVYKGNIIKNLIMDCQSYTKYRPNETTGGIFVSWRRKEELPTGA